MNIKKLTLIFLCVSTVLTQVPAHAMETAREAFKLFVGPSRLADAAAAQGNQAAMIANNVGNGLMVGCVAGALYMGRSFYKEIQTGHVFEAIKQKNNDALLICVQRNKDLVGRPSNVGRTPLCESHRKSNCPAAAILLAAGANPNQKSNIMIGDGQREKVITLHGAVLSMDRTFTSLLMASGALPLLTDDSNLDAFKRLNSVIVFHGIGAAQLMERKNEMRMLLNSKEESKKYVFNALQSDAELKALPESVKRDLFNRIGVGQMQQAAATFMETGNDSALKYEFNKDRWMFRHLTQAGQEKSFVSQLLTKQSGRRPALPADVVRYIRTFLDRNNISQGELKPLLLSVEGRAAHIGNQEVSALARIAQVNERAVKKAPAVQKSKYNKNSNGKWQVNNKGINRPRKNEVQHA